MFLGDPNLEVINKGQILRIKSARLGDKARYQCSVMNTAGKQSKDFNLSVYGECGFSQIISIQVLCVKPSLYRLNPCDVMLPTTIAFG